MFSFHMTVCWHVQSWGSELYIRCGSGLRCNCIVLPVERVLWSRQHCDKVHVVPQQQTVDFSDHIVWQASHLTENWRCTGSCRTWCSMIISALKQPSVHSYITGSVYQKTRFILVFCATENFKVLLFIQCLSSSIHFFPVMSSTNSGPTAPWVWHLVKANDRSMFHPLHHYLADLHNSI